MASVRDIERDIAELRAWFAEFDAAAWDKEFEDDALSGRLDAMAEAAMAEHRRGRCKEL